MELIEDTPTVERVIMEKSKSTGTPVYGCLELTPLCNMNCEMCYVRLDHREMQRQGRLRTAKEWLEVGNQMQQSGTLFVLLTGGEPLLHPDFQEIYLGLRNLGMILTINTNGTLLDEKWADFFALYPPRRINITLYGKDAEAYQSLCHYKEGYNKAICAVQLLVNRGVDVKINVSAARANADDIDKIIALEEQLGVPVRVDAYMMPAVRERNKPYDMQSRLTPTEAARVQFASLRQEMGPHLFEQYVIQALNRVEEFVPSDKPRKMTCYAGNSSFTINWQGNLRPCVVMSSPTANVFEHGFLSAWKAVHSESQKIRLNLKCSQCSLGSLCRTCAASAILETGEYQGIPEYMCSYAKETYRLLRLEKECCHD